MNAEWRVIVLFQMDPCSKWETVKDKVFFTKEEAETFKSKWEKNTLTRTTLYHYEPCWVIVDDRS